MADDRVLIEIEMDDGSFKKGFAKFRKEAEDSGDKAGKSLEATLGASFTKIGALALAAGATIGASLFSRASIDAAVGKENAVQKLNQSLASAGRFSQEASAAFEAFADEIERTTKIDGDAALELVALANNFAKTDDQARRLTEAAIDLSSATGRDLNTSLEQLGKTLSGNLGRLGQEIPTLQGLTKEQLRAGAAIDGVISRFGGSAVSEVNTFGGAITQLKNNFGKLLEEIGNFVVKDKVVITFLKALGDAFSRAASNIANIRGSSDTARSAVGNLLIILVQVAEVVNKYLVAPLELAFNFIKTGFQAVVTGVLGFVALLVNGFEKLISLLPTFDAFTGFKAALKDASEFANNALSTSFNSLAITADNALNVNLAGSTALFLEDLRSKMENAKDITQDFKNNFNKDTVPEVQIALVTLASSFGELAKGASDSILQLKIDAVKNFRAMGAAALQGLGGATSQAFAAFGQALASGGDAAQAFSDTFLKVIGGVLVQLGQGYILQGIAASVNPLTPGAGGPLIAAGAALSVFGGLLQGAGGAGVGKGATSGAGEIGTPGGNPVVGPAPGETVGPVDEAVVERVPNTEVSINIQGDVLDSDETGLRIVDILNSAFDKQGVIIKRGALA